jgi:hypothetical protein
MTIPPPEGGMPPAVVHAADLGKLGARNRGRAHVGARMGRRCGERAFGRLSVAGVARTCP